MKKKTSRPGTHTSRNIVSRPAHVLDVFDIAVNLHKQGFDICGKLATGQMLYYLLKPLRDLFLFQSDAVHNFQISVNALDLPLQFALFSDVEEWYNEVAETVVNICVCQS